MSTLPLKLTDGDLTIQLLGIAIIDLEASGLGSAGFPTEIGWAILHDDGSITSGACLIRPPAKWTMYANAWSPASERLTGITREMLDRDGVSPREAVERFLEAVGDRDLLSDEPDFDTHWLGMLVDAVGVSLGERTIRDLNEFMRRPGLRPKFEEPPRHRAEADAMRLAIALCGH
jgi:DNA polymerase III epsilon subunit-like protein